MFIIVKSCQDQTASPFMGKGRLEAKKVTRLGRESEKKEKTNCSVGTDKREEMFIVLFVFREEKNNA